MAIAALEIPHINPLRFVPVEGELLVDPRDNMVHFDADWFVNYIRDWQTQTDYNQKWQFNDRIAFQMHANTNKGIQLFLLDCNGRIWNTWTQTQFSTITGNTIAVGGKMEPAFTYHMRFRFGDVSGLPEGIYWLQLVVAYDLNGDNTVDYYRNCVSEPISIATKHFGTTRLDYYHTSNAQDIFFKQTNARFSLRVEADIVDYDTVAKATQYEDGAYNATLLAAQVYRTAKYALTARVPEWMKDKITRAWACNRVSVDSLPFTAEIEAKWDTNRVTRHPKVSAALPIREADNRQGARQIFVNSVPIYTLPAYPFAVTQVGLIDSAGVVTELMSPFDAVIIHNGTEHNAFIATLNAAAANDYFNGSFSMISGVLTWTNAAGDLVISSISTIYDQPLTYDITTSGVAIPFGFYNGDIIVDWGDMPAVIERVTTTGFGNPQPYTYASSGTYTVSIYGVCQILTLLDTQMTAIGGNVPDGVVIFQQSGANGLTTFDASIFSNVDNIIQEIGAYTNGGMTTVTNLSSLALPVITQISFAGNALTHSAVDGILIDLDTTVNANRAPKGVSLYLNGQTPARKPGIPGKIAESDLTTYFNWNIYTD